jgi:hypothetical protein
MKELSLLGHNDNTDNSNSWGSKALRYVLEKIIDGFQFLIRK